MGKKAAFLLAHALLVVATYVIVGLTVAGWLAGIMPPQKSWVITVLSLGMTPLLAINLLLVLWWAYKRKLLAILPLAAILLNIGFITSMFQFDTRKSSAVRSDLKVVSYNIHGFGQSDLRGTMDNLALYFNKEEVDIVCFQEFWTTEKCPIDSIQASFSQVMPYHAAHPQETGTELAIFSKYPISASGLLSFPETANSTMWADIEVGGRRIRVFNAHFQTTNINQSQDKIYRLRDRGITDQKGKEAFDDIMDRLYLNACKRTEQVEKVRAVMDTTSEPMIFCGDFNDTPASYTYKRIKGELKDGFKSAGKGYASTFKPMLGLFRLDYIFHSPEFTGMKYYSPDLSWSDHHPVMLELDLGN